MSRKTAALGITALTLIASAWTPASAHGGRDLWATVTIVPGREGIVEAAGYSGPALGVGSRLTLTAPEGTASAGTARTKGKVCSCQAPAFVGPV